MEKCNCRLSKVLIATILEMSDCEDMKEAIEYFEENRYKPHLLKTQEYFDEININQLAILFKLLLDTNQLKLIENKIVSLEDTT